MVASVLATPLNLNPVQKSWLAAHRNQVLTVGFDPYTGVDNFEFRGKQQGFLKELLTDMSTQLAPGVQIFPSAAFGYALRLQPEDSLDACMAQCRRFHVCSQKQHEKTQHRSDFLEPSSATLERQGKKTVFQSG